MIKPNWEIFKAKFNGNPQDNFEWFCYLLFCKEFNKQFGIFRFKNQSAIETNPINSANEVIGWQAKFYDTPLSSHKNDLLDTIENSKRDYPEITKLFFYTNQEWGQNKGKKPQGLIDVEEKGRGLNLILEWRSASFFESEFVAVNNQVLAKHFFTLEKSIFMLMEQQQKHTENILNQIQKSISFNNQDIEIDRSEQLHGLISSSHQISILSGAGGVGKTVLIKNLYEKVKNKIPFIVLKATEFELRDICDLYVNFSVYDFIEAHKDEKNKIVVIDSSEKLLDLKNHDPFKEFLLVLIREKWKIIFTTRDSYLEDLNYQFFEIYNIAPLNISIRNLGLMDLRDISKKYSFSLPKDEKLQELIRNPFYLNEYLKFYKDKEELEYVGFKNKLWSKNIKKSKPERELCFLQIAFERAQLGQFFISLNGDSNALSNELVGDGILGYEIAGYFIAHDIYEEWALEKIIEREFINKASTQGFFKKIGQSLPIRRSFRNWLSEKLFLKNNEIKIFIEEVIDFTEIELFWKDEILVSILLSDYSKIFFEIFKEELLSNGQKLLRRLTFILRIACKEVDDCFYKRLNVNELSLSSLKYVLTKPKGFGWISLIKFVYENIELIGIKNINFILPVIHDWNKKTKEGEATRFSALIALQYYQWIIFDNVYLSRDDTKEHLLQTIIYGVSEVKGEFEEIFNEIIDNEWKNYGDPYFDLSKIILIKIEGIHVSKFLPGSVLKLANLFWSCTDNEVEQFYRSQTDIERHFGLESNHSDYFPASAYQTPIYWLLYINFKETIDFILSFTNKSVRKYATSGFDNSVQEVDVFLGKNNKKRQYISHCLWNLYRGTGSPVSPYLLQSIHMALEKYFLEEGKNIEANILESWLLYLLKDTESASISSVVASIVLAYPDKTFNVAKILFKTKEFIINDTTRLISDNHAESLYSIGKNFGVERNEFYDQERIKTCDDKHRKISLENIFLHYQIFKSQDIEKEKVVVRQKELWGILDDYYKELPIELAQSGSDKTWRLFLARMDGRKLIVTTEKTDSGIAIQFIPKLEPDLKKYSESSLAEALGPIKYIDLKNWAILKFEKNNEYKKNNRYENDSSLALREVKEIVSEFNRGDECDFGVASFFEFNYSIPAYVCSVLIENNFDELSVDDRFFCKNVIIQFAEHSLDFNYQYQVHDGTQPAIFVLPKLLKYYSEEKLNIKIILLINLFNDTRVGGLLSNDNFSMFPIMAMRQLWIDDFSCAQSVLLGYIFLKPKYDDLRIIIRKERRDDDFYESRMSDLLKEFIDDDNEQFNLINDDGKLRFDLKIFEEYDLSILRTVFRLIPQKTDRNDHKEIAKAVTSVFAKKMMLADREDKIDYQIKFDFLKAYTYFVLRLPIDEIPSYLNQFLDNFKASESVVDLFEAFIFAEDNLNTYDNFWFVWSKFKEKIFDICKDGDERWYSEKIVKSYLFATVSWKKNVKEWRSLKDKNKRFFAEISKTIGHCPSCLYSIAKLLNNIGCLYIDDGVFWISGILNNNRDLTNKKIEDNTIEYLENYVRKYIFKNREMIKRNKSIKDNLLVILDYLIEKGSVVGYMLRESII